jgi:magnesium-protoporphyrin O-methyltransferase
MNCSCCAPGDINNLDKFFNPRLAQAEAQHYLKKGLEKRAQVLIAYLLNHLTQPASILDIGCGAGGVHHELLRQGVARSVIGVDASAAYLAAAQANAVALNLTHAVTYAQRDFAQSSNEFAPAEVVLMDRVICCYPHLRQLLAPAAQRVQRYLALSFPVEAWWLRWPFYLVDAALTLFRSKYHPYLHAHAQIIALAQEAGLQLVHRDRYRWWQIMIFAQTPHKGDDSYI